MVVRLPYAKSELYAMAKSKRQHKKLVELVFDAKYSGEDVCTTENARCMELMNARVEKSEANASKAFGRGHDLGIFKLVVVHDKYPVLIHFNSNRKTVLADISVPIASSDGTLFKIHDLREILSWASVDDITVPQAHIRQCIPGTRYCI